MVGEGIGQGGQSNALERAGKGKGMALGRRAPTLFPHYLQKRQGGKGGFCGYVTRESPICVTLLNVRTLGKWGFVETPERKLISFPFRGYKCNYVSMRKKGRAG